MNVIKEALSGHPIIAAEKVWDTMLGIMPPSVAAIIDRVASDEFQIAIRATEKAAEDILANGVNSASFIKAAVDAFNVEVELNKSLMLPDFFAALNLNVAKLQAAQTGSSSGAV